ncbi:unnamed protein product [Soboliphyme baturini]|uniref:Uncharacterized protein n=1 Tax=Soboliphyme baturini TaxID=241478 RepID=A0A183IKP1_9BILA|nr:unnamed protein product [Soboliphyme baturini]
MTLRCSGLTQSLDKLFGPSGFVVSTESLLHACCPLHSCFATDVLIPTVLHQCEKERSMLSLLTYSHYVHTCMDAMSKAGVAVTNDLLLAVFRYALQHWSLQVFFVVGVCQSLAPSFRSKVYERVVRWRCCDLIRLICKMHCATCSTRGVRVVDDRCSFMMTILNTVACADPMVAQKYTALAYLLPFCGIGCFVSHFGTDLVSAFVAFCRQPSLASTVADLMSCLANADQRPYFEDNWVMEICNYVLSTDEQLAMNVIQVGLAD